MNRIKQIKHYPSNLVIISDREDDYNIYELNYDGLQGELNKEEWKERLPMYTEEEKEEILNALDMTYNKDFFS